MKRNKQWLNSRHQMATPKLFNVQMVRMSDGTFHVVGGETKVLIRKNQHVEQWEDVNTRDFTRVLRKSKINSF